MGREVDLTKIVSNLSKLGVKATTTKSRLELLKAIAPPKQSPQAQN
ncbi:Lmo0850 family protein [Viridibacillus arvi]|nr:Lmo0850 family protein [Viridibacillus arvi]